MILRWILNYYLNIWMFLGFPGGSDCKESACNAGDLCLIPGSLRPWVRRIPWRREWLPTPVFLPGEFHGQRSLVGYGLWGHRVRHNWATNIWVFSSFAGGSDGKESACNAGDLGLIPGLGRSPGEQHCNPLQYSCLENPHGQRRLVGCSP